MTTHRLSGLQRRILRQISQAEARSKWRVTASHDGLVRALGGNKGTLSTSVRNLEAKGLIKVWRTPGGKAESVELTREGKNRVTISARSLD